MLNKIKIENKNKDKTKILIIKLRFFETEKKTLDACAMYIMH